MLGKLLRTHLGPYKKLLLLVVGLQAVQATAALLLPAINSNIINFGVLRGDTGYIGHEGAVMVGITLVQGTFAALRCTSAPGWRWPSVGTCARACSIRSRRSRLVKSVRSVHRR